MNDERTGARESFYFEGGIRSYVRKLNEGKEVVTDDIFYVEKGIEDSDHRQRAGLPVVWTHL